VTMNMGRAPMNQQPAPPPEDQQPDQDTTSIEIPGIPEMPGVVGTETKIQPRTITPSASQYADILAQEGAGALRPLPGSQQVAGQPTSYIYTGPKLLDKNGAPVRGQYDEIAESLSELAKLPTAERMAIQSELARRGFYGKNGKPSQNGFEPKDKEAMSQLLGYANYWGYTWEDSFPLVMSNFPAMQSGRAARPAAEIRKSLDQQALEALGRKFTDPEVQGLIAQIRKREAGGDTTTLSTMAEQTVATANPDEQQAYRFVQVANLLNDMLRTG
jgi:hypothetical protein